jgi:hypothetical protein
LDIHNQIDSIIDESILIKNIQNLFFSSCIVDDAMTKLFIEIEKILGFDRIGIAFIDYANEKIIAEYGVASYQNILLGSGFEIDISKTSLTKLISSKKSQLQGPLKWNLEVVQIVRL